MQRIFLAPLVLSLGLFTVGCDKRPSPEVPVVATPIAVPVAKTKTLETLELALVVKDYERDRTPVNAARVKKAIAELQGEIAELDQRAAEVTGTDHDEAVAKRKNLNEYLSAQTLRFKAAEAGAAIGTAPAVDSRTGAEKVEDSAKRVGVEIKDAAEKTADAIKDAVK